MIIKKHVFLRENKTIWNMVDFQKIKTHNVSLGDNEIYVFNLRYATIKLAKLHRFVVIRRNGSGRAI